MNWQNEIKFLENFFCCNPPSSGINAIVSVHELASSSPLIYNIHTHLIFETNLDVESQILSAKAGIAL
jgi:hypothetical protein